MLNELINFVQEPSEDNASGPFFEKLAGPARGWSPQNDRSASHSVHRSRTGPRERPKAAHNRQITWADRPPGPEPLTFVAVTPPLTHWHCARRALAATCGQRRAAD